MTNKPAQLFNQNEIVQSLKGFPIDLLKIYPKSFCSVNGLTYGLVRTSDRKKLVVMGEKRPVLSDLFMGKCYHQTSTLKVCDLSPENTGCLFTFFPHTRPVSLRNHEITVGTGDRLGVATPGHIRAVRKFQVHPVLAQQSVRENRQTGRDFAGVIREAAWAVFEENYRDGYGADGDHLKSLHEVEDALGAGVSMITLDPSEKLNSDAFSAPKDVVNRRLKEEVDEGDFEVLLHLFLGKEFLFEGPYGEVSIQFDEENVKRNTLFFNKAVDLTEEAYEFILSRSRGQDHIDFEISLDEMPFPTSPESHLFFIITLNHRGVHIDSLAPRFIGEFQKGIDYRGDIEPFRRQFYQHFLVAQDYGKYKISIHSGSDKFSILPCVGELAKRGLHLKTAGTSWLEAIRLVAFANPFLYREIHRFALSKFREASKLYHVTADPNKIQKLENLNDQELPNLLDQEDCRQVLHITYGSLIHRTPEKGKSPFRDQIYRILDEYEEDYWSLLEKHFEKHLSSLGVERRKEDPQDLEGERDK